MLGITLAMLLVAAFVSCLFSTFLPSSASLLASTSTPTPTLTSTPTATSTPQPTFTSLPPELVTPYVTELPGYTVYWRRELWESAIDAPFAIEDFEKDLDGYGELDFPYMTGNGFLLEGKSAAQLLGTSGLLPSGNLLHFRDWEQGLTFTFPASQSVTAFGFDYTSSEVWRLTVNHVEITLRRGGFTFVGIILHQDFPKTFRLMGPQTAQGGLAVDNISYIP
jgi:hypothetical protein